MPPALEWLDDVFYALGINFARPVPRLIRSAVVFAIIVAALAYLNRLMNWLSEISA